MDVTVWWCSLTAAEHAVLDLLDPAEKARVEALQRPADRARSLLGAALLRVAVADRLGVAPAEVVVDRTCDECGGPHGAPQIVGPGRAGLQVSVSHSGLLVVAAVTAQGAVGVDVQRLADLDHPTLGSRWVRREALLKARTPRRRTLGIGQQHVRERPVVRNLSAPLDGYAAALATVPGGRFSVAVRQWRGSGTKWTLPEVCPNA